MRLYPPPQHARHENNFYKARVDLAPGLLAGLRQAGLTLPAPLHDPCAGDGALLDGLGLVGFGSDFSQLHIHPITVPAGADRRARRRRWRRVLCDARVLVSVRLSDSTLSACGNKSRWRPTRTRSCGGDAGNLKRPRHAFLEKEL